MEELAELIQNGQAKRILVLCGAGISTGAGIPDFRSPGTGLYDNLSKYNLPYPEAIFDVDYYRKKPDAFVSLAKELWPGIVFKPTQTHYFLKILADKGLLLRIYTQNIDGLEFLAGIPDDKLVECHGHFRTSACIDCHKASDTEQVKETIVQEMKTPVCIYCRGYVKPDVVFFGESLPNRFHSLLKKDIPKADILLVMGTSLQVAPVSLIPNMVRCNRVLFNRDKVIDIRPGDMFLQGDCDSNVEKLVSLLGWVLQTEELNDNEEQEENRGVERSEEETQNIAKKDDGNEREEGKETKARVANLEKTYIETNNQEEMNENKKQEDASEG